MSKKWTSLLVFTGFSVKVIKNVDKFTSFHWIFSKSYQKRGKVY